MMKSTYLIKNNSVHLWQVFLPELITQISELGHVLSVDEKQRAERFRFLEHQQRFILARSILRHLLQQYTEIPATKLQFAVSERGKPFLVNNPSAIQFNLSHSHDFAVYAFSLQTPIGVDIEKITPRTTMELAQRFFSATEYHALTLLAPALREQAFYRLWAGKEAILKACGEGLHMSLASFSVAWELDKQLIKLADDRVFYLQHVSVANGYQAAIATAEPFVTLRQACFIPALS